jgi:two-component system, cell cycle response regulator
MVFNRSAAEGVARLALASAALGLLLFGAYSVTGLGWAPLDDFAARWLSVIVPALAGLALGARALLLGRERTGWMLVGLSLVAWGAGSAYYSAVLWTADPMPFPSPADALWLAVYPLAYAGLARLARARSESSSQVSWLDGVIGGLAVAAVGAAVAFGQIVASTGGSTFAIATNLAYPLGDLVLIALAVGLVPLAVRRFGRSWAVLVAGFVVFGVADSLYLYRIAADTYEAGSLLDGGWMLAAVIIATAAWQPRASARVLWRGWSNFVFPVSFGGLSVGVLVYDHFQRVHLLALVLAAACLLAVLARMTLVFRENLIMLASSREEATTDSLTGLGNRRRLLFDLERIDAPCTLVLLDLDGFKAYNDTFGHLTGDALLERLGRSLAGSLAEGAAAYRMGGDEFCVLSPETVDAATVAAGAAHSLREHGNGFEITSSYGFVSLPREADDTSAALRLADARMYAQKQHRRASAGSQSKDVLVRALEERNPLLVDHIADIADLAVDIGRRLGLGDHELGQLRHVAELHDVGKVAIPDAILLKHGPLDDEEWAFVHQHPVIGERIVGAAPSLTVIARSVRSTHERWDGLGYPDGICGEEIPLAARIVAVCDAVSAMVSDRPYRDAIDLPEALAELARCAGTQFDPEIVATARAALTDVRAAAAA